MSRATSLVIPRATFALRLFMAAVLAFGLMALPAPARAWAVQSATTPSGSALDFTDSAVVSLLKLALEDSSVNGANGANAFIRVSALTDLGNPNTDQNLEAYCASADASFDSARTYLADADSLLASDISKVRSSAAAWEAGRATLAGVVQKYSSVLAEYQTFLDAARAYSVAKRPGGQGLDDRLRELKAAKAVVIASFGGFSVDSFKNDAQTIAALCMPDADGLLQQAAALCGEGQAFEHQKFATLSGQANECIAALAYVGMLNRVWVDYQASLDSDPSHVNPEDKEAPQEARDGWKIVADTVMSSTNGLADQMQTLASTLMRPYDFEVAVELGGSDGSGLAHMDGSYGNGVYKRPVDLPLASSWTSKTMNAYQAKPLGTDTKPFLLVKGTGADALVHGNLIAKQSDQKDAYSWEYADMNLDGYNLLSSRDGNYRLIDGAGDLAGLVSADSYSLSGSTDLSSYLATYGDMDPGLVPTDTALTSTWTSKASADGTSEKIGRPGLVGSWCFAYDYVADLSNYGLGQTADELKARMATADTSAAVFDKSLLDKEMLVMLKGNDAGQSHTVGIEQAWHTTVTLADANGNPIVSGDSIASGTTLGITVNSTFAAGFEFRALELVDRSGNVIDTLLTADGFNLSAQDNPDGSSIVTMTTTMPYQDCIMRALESDSTGGDVEPAQPVDGADCALAGLDDGDLLLPGSTVSFEASGTEGTAIGTVLEKQTQLRLRPVSWSIELASNPGMNIAPQGSWTGDSLTNDGAFSVDYLAGTGLYRLTVTFAREHRLMGEAWTDIGAPYKLSRTFTLHDKHVTTDPPEPLFMATLDTSGLKNATATLSRTEGIKAGDAVTLTVKPRDGFMFLTAPSVAATGAAAGIPTAGADGSYTCEIASFSGDAAIVVEGVASAKADPEPDPQPDPDPTPKPDPAKPLPAPQADSKPLATTGDPLPAAPLAGIAMLAGIAALAACAIRRARK